MGAKEAEEAEDKQIEWCRERAWDLVEHMKLDMSPADTSTCLCMALAIVLATQLRKSTTLTLDDILKFESDAIKQEVQLINSALGN
jgi:hypothetical protein